MEIIYGTRNLAKVMSMKKMLCGLDLQLKDLSFFEHLPVVEEIGSSPLDNARAKAETYYRFFASPVFACDSGLYIEGLDSGLQPGAKVRRKGSKVLNDDEMIDYYKKLLEGLGGQAVAHYGNAILPILDDDQKRWLMDDTMEETFYLVSRPHPARVESFPKSSLSIDIQLGKYFAVATDEEKPVLDNCLNGSQKFLSQSNQFIW
ncbi:hypothetical protein BG32_12255 [Mesotoga sp. HF07.pep.5.2.highcov]|uniref:non-canonical purine NTP pyrophosphatase n=1 Tax=Mesotoga sp. HF07.pep.5.2.highcov TaxID=1462923 RepID=UPI000FEF13F4|nr:non-canonical purine NTP pyrophosphatase [Mesotoga sp. HF07.pep.5.2.highcov]RLL92290.1 hypothetical protein BG32_12255 [Mesotoga sp. HF07.pep.5.2.highcov]